MERNLIQWITCICLCDPTSDIQLYRFCFMMTEGSSVVNTLENKDNIDIKVGIQNSVPIIIHLKLFAIIEISDFDIGTCIYIWAYISIFDDFYLSINRSPSSEYDPYCHHICSTNLRKVVALPTDYSLISRFCFEQACMVNEHLRILSMNFSNWYVIQFFLIR